MFVAAATISTPTPTPDGAVHDGVWVSSGVVRESRPSEHVRVFEVPAGSPHRVLVIDAAARNLTGVSLRHITSCDHDSWYPMASYDRAASKPAGFSCWFARATADSLLADFNEDAVLADAMRGAFNTTRPCEHRENRVVRALGGKWWRSLLYPLHRSFRDVRAWALAIHEEMEPDVYHVDGHEMLARAPGSDLVTVITYPSAPSAEQQQQDDGAGAGAGGAWDDGWGGELLVAAEAVRHGHEQRATTARLRERAPGLYGGAALRIAPRPDRVVAFSGALLHRSTPPSDARPPSRTLPALAAARLSYGGARVPVPTEARWRFSSVMQLTCHNGRYHGPYEEDTTPSVLPRLALAAAVLVLGVYFGHIPNPLRKAAPATEEADRDASSGSTPGALSARDERRAAERANKKKR